MKAESNIVVVLTVLLLLSANFASGIVNTRGIDTVRTKAILDNADLQVIDTFIAEAVRDLVATRDFTATAKTRSIILARASSRTGAQAQYADQFFKSANNHIAMALRQAQQLTPEDRSFKVILNLLILIDNLASPQLAELPILFLHHKSNVIRYWSVHCITNPLLVQQINSTRNIALAARIAEQLTGLIVKASPEMIRLMVTFAARANAPQAEAFLLQIADSRIKKYADWQVRYALLDAEVLKALHGKIATGLIKPKVARRFAQLYSYTMQRYIKGQNSISFAQKRQLASVLVEVEKSCVSKLLSVPQTAVKRAVERTDLQALSQEHDRLFGTQTTPGQLPSKLNFDYSTSPTGPKRPAPIPLPEPPATQPTQ